MLELRESANRRPEGIRADKGSRFVLRLAIMVGAVLAIVAGRSASAATTRSANIASWIGWAFSAVASPAALELPDAGRYFTFTVQTSGDQPVITSGPYRVIRHPSYAGILVAFMGIGLLLGNWLSLIGLSIAVTCGLVFRIRVEERALLRALGADYRTYAATHKRLVPFIW